VQHSILPRCSRSRYQLELEFLTTHGKAQKMDITVERFQPLTKDNLDAFVNWIDSNGGPDSPSASIAWKAALKYSPATRVNQALDPFSEQYWQHQCQLYKEISGRDLNQVANELTEFVLEDHVGTANSYASTDPARMVIHYIRLSKLIKYAALPNNARVLDLGCGWGLSSEFFASMGCRVTAVDINKKFVELIRRRSSRLNFEIEAIQSNFDDLHLDQTFDLVVFYESLHHAIRPHELLKKVSGWLSVNGKIALAGEPIQDIWWNNWGLRLDPLSIYCMRKFGWFENGWSKGYITAALSKCGLDVDYRDDADPDIGPTIIASRTNVTRLEIPPPQISSEPLKTTVATKIASRLDLLRRGIGLIRQATSLSFLVRRWNTGMRFVFGRKS
jgi:2-polyprenyl-3-methyl-5-hydroxy-6-metoxy-1,4-benzoquinol methylase